jgi:ABC-2 type transport system ATP-binding protein
VAIVEARNLTKNYVVADKAPGLRGTLRHLVNRQTKVVQAVKGISFDIGPGEVVGFLGPNGAGKTTALKMLTGLIHPTSGSAVVAGHIPFRRQRAFLQQITLVMGQKQQLIWDLPAIDSLRINAAVYQVPEAEARQRIERMSQMLGMTGLLTKPVRKLSLGERMKAELMAALLHQPRVLFLDEPTLGLDVNAQAAVREFLRSYNQQFGACVLLTSHYMADITALCPRVLVIHEGRLIYDGSLDGIRSRFAPYREVKLELVSEIDGQSFDQYGEVALARGHEVRLIVQRAQLTRTVDRLLGDLEVVDLTVTDPPIEEIIGRIFKDGTTGEGKDQPQINADERG